jgi:beta-glucanase (GH16 family)
MASSKTQHIWRQAAVWAICLTLFSTAIAGPKGKRPKPEGPAAQGAFTDHLQQFDSARWSKADGWSNGTPFDNAWSADNVTFQDNQMALSLDDTPSLGQPYTSGEYRSNGYYGYGCYEVSMKPVAAEGLVTAFFTFAGPSDNGGNGRHNEIDVEFPGTTEWVQFNFWTNDDDYSSRNEYLHPLSFDASQAFHVYAFKWTSTGINWYIDGDLIYQVFDTDLNPTPKAAESLHKIMLNLWAVDESAELWAGTFAYPGAPVQARYDWVRFTEGEDCSLQPPPQEPAPPEPIDDGAVYIADLQLSLNNRGTQAIAQMTVRTGTGQPARNAAVSGQWSGVINKGDTTRDTDADGDATFYSARSRSSGEVQFCVTDIMLAGYDYDATANTRTCGSIEK